MSIINENEEKDTKNVNEEINKKENLEGKKKEKKFLKNFKEFCTKYSVVQFVSIGIPLFFFTLLLVAQLKSVSNTEEVIQGKRESELADSLVNLQSKYDDLKQKYDESQEIVEEYKNNSATNNSLINSMNNTINNLSTISGSTDLKGEGIIITLSDGDKNITTDSNTLVHDSDILTLVNELQAAGAEAISVNNQRIISTTAIRCVGPVIQVNYQKVASPFVIRAIGNSQYLESAMNIKNGIVDTLKEYGINITLTRSDEVEILKYDGTINFRYSKEVKK